MVALCCHKPQPCSGAPLLGRGSSFRLLKPKGESKLESNQLVVNFKEIEYGGFLRRFVALIIDSILVSFCVFPLILAIDIFSPGHVVVTTPFDLLSEERVLETEKSTLPNPDGSQTAVETKIVEKKYMNKWTYTYRVVNKSNAGQKSSDNQLIDPTTKLEIHKTTTESVNLFFLFIYLILMESSRYRASLGKLALGLKVQDKDGNQLTILRSAGRNFSKLLSVMTLFIGFMMAGWTKNKQALHDIVAGCFVVRS